MITEVIIEDTLIDTICDHLRYLTMAYKKVNGHPKDETKREFLIRKLREYPQNAYEAGRNGIDKADKPTRLSDVSAKLQLITAKEIIT